jgi:sugar lactone lactonase YvrE
MRLTLATLVALFLSAAAHAERLVLVAGSGTRTTDSGPATEWKLQAPFGIDFDKDGTAYVVELTGQRVFKIDSKATMTRIAGGEKGNAGDGGPADKAQFNGMHSLAVSPRGIFLADTMNNRVRRLDLAAGTIAAFAGTGEKGNSGDGGPAEKARFGGVYCVALDPAGRNLYLVDLDHRRVRAVDLESGVVRAVAGNGKRGVPSDGAVATEAPLVDPRAVAVDSKNNVYVLERGGNALRVVDAGGKVRTVVGTGEKGPSGDGGPAKEVKLNGPKHLCIDREDNVIIADTENHVILKYLPREEKVIRIAGTGQRGKGRINRPPLEVQLQQPHGVAFHPDGTLYIVDSSNNRVLKVEK